MVVRYQTKVMVNLITQNLVTLVSKIFSSGVFYKKTLSKIISLTIDDVGDTGTIQILDAIDRFNHNLLKDRDRIRATFFVISDKLRDSLILDEILKRGHEIGNHGEQDHFHVVLSPNKFATEIERTHQILSSNRIKHKIKWFRPGRALYNKSMLQSLKELTGYYDRFALASMLPLDTLPIIKNPSFTLKYVSKFIFPGSILLLHGGDTERTANTVAVLDKLLPQLREKEYQVVTLSELWESN
ncbi:MAG: polysaccharide deacetylase family protein [Xenococcaceae cyanobacterium MO_188.B19]|nr:polysaccharide deacetylase family protein [Xenococcaceae cyanobacterium MO_188.B19]